MIVFNKSRVFKQCQISWKSKKYPIQGICGLIVHNPLVSCRFLEGPEH